MRVLVLVLAAISLFMPRVSFVPERDACAMGCCDPGVAEDCCGAESVSQVVAGCCCADEDPLIPLVIGGDLEFDRVADVHRSAKEPARALAGQAEGEPSSLRVSPETPPPRER